MKKNKISIVGAGVGGLALAARLSCRGFKVDVFEKLAHPGGRNNLLEDKGFKFDMGPSFVLMPDFFHEVFSYCGEKLDNFLKFQILETNYKIIYADGSHLSVFKDRNKTKDELEKIEPGAGLAYDKFIAETTRIYDAVRPLLYKCFTPKDLFNPKYWGLLTKIRALESYWGLARKFFKSEKLAFAFTFEAMFMGVSPYQAPAFYSVISYADHVQKIFHPMGGMYQIPLALEKMAKGFGAKFNYNAEARSITGDNGSISLAVNGSVIETDFAAVNADYAYTQTNLLKRKIPQYKYSCSVYLVYLGLKKKVRNLEHHNLFFAKDLNKNLKEIFDFKFVPDDPSFYVHVPTVTDPSLAPAGKDILYLLIPVANLENNPDSLGGKEAALRKIVFKRIEQEIGEDLEPLIEVEHRFYPQDFIGRYNIKHGATFGLAHNLMQSAFFRPKNFDSRIKNLYFLGASTQPGGGLPVVIAGSRIVADLVQNNQ